MSFLPTSRNSEIFSKSLYNKSMPRSEIPKAVEQSVEIVSKEKSPIEAQQEKWNAILEKLKRIEPKLDHGEKFEIALSIFCNSVRDGRKVAEVLALSHDDVEGIVASSSFFSKQKEVAKSLLSMLSGIPISSMSEGTFSTYQGLEQFLDLTDDLPDEEREFRFRKEQEKRGGLKERLNKKSGGIMDDLETYYAEFLKGHEVGPLEEPPDKRSKGEQMGERLLGKLDAALQGMFYAEPVIDYVYAHLPKEARKRGLSKREAILEVCRNNGGDAAYESISEFFSQDIFRIQDIWELFFATGLDPEIFGHEFEEEINQKLPQEAQYKLLDITAGVEERESTRELRKELEESVGKRFPGLVLEKDETTGVWKFVPRITESKKEEKEQASQEVVEGFDAKEFIRTGNFPQGFYVEKDSALTGCYLIHKGDEFDFILDSKGNMIGTPHKSIWNLHLIQNSAYYVAADGYDFDPPSFIVGPHGKEYREYGNVARFYIRGGFVVINNWQKSVEGSMTQREAAYKIPIEEFVRGGKVPKAVEVKKEGEKKSFEHLEVADFEQQELVYPPERKGSYKDKPRMDFSGKDMWYATSFADGMAVVSPDGIAGIHYDGGIREITALDRGVEFIRLDKQGGSSFAISRSSTTGKEEELGYRGDLVQIVRLGEGRGDGFAYKRQIKNRNKEKFITPYPHTREVHRDYEQIKQAYVFKGELYYVAREGDKEFLVYPDGKEGGTFRQY